MCEAVATGLLPMGLPICTSVREHDRQFSTGCRDGFVPARDMSVSRLLVDALSMGFCPDAARNDHWWCLEEMQKKIQALVTAAKADGIEITAYVNSTLQREPKGQRVWKSRREEEFRERKRGVPQGMSNFVGDILRECGARVFYSTADHCGTMVADAIGSDILSGSRRFFEYDLAQHNIRAFTDYEVVNGVLFLRPQAVPESKAFYKPIPCPHPRTCRREPTFELLEEDGTYMRGDPVPEFQDRFPNMHKTARKLFAALLHRKGIAHVNQVLLEAVPESAGASRWVPCKVYADPELDALLDSPRSAYVRVFGGHQKPEGVTDRAWGRFTFSALSIINEICEAAQAEPRPLFDAMMNTRPPRKGTKPLEGSAKGPTSLRVSAKEFVPANRWAKGPTSLEGSTKEFVPANRWAKGPRGLHHADWQALGRMRACAE